MISGTRALVRVALHVWVAPNTLLGLLAGALVLCFGGKLRFARGAAEFCGGRVGSAARSLPRSMRFGAMTLGYVILGQNEATLAAARDHEHVHIRQYELWGPLFLFAYLGSSLWQFANGRHGYWDNAFEKQAYERAGG